MPNRILREGILTSPRIAKLGWPEEVFYRRLHSVVDDFGRFFADPGMLRAACYPRQLNKVSDSDVGKWLHACEAAALVRVYRVDGEAYLHVLDFGQQVRAKKSKFPDMPSGCAADAKQVQSNAHLDVSVSVSEGESSSASADAEPVLSGFAIPLNDGSEWAIPLATVEEWAQAYPAVDVPQELREMRAWANANPAKRKTSRGVAAFAVRWLSKAQDTPGRSSGLNGAGRRDAEPFV